MYKNKLKQNKDIFEELDFNLIEVKDGKVNARGLWQFLEIGKEFANWIKDLIQKYDFLEGEDFDKIVKPQENNKKDYLLEIDTAKEIAMVSNTENGKKARRYFIECEKKLKEKSQPNKQLSTVDVLELATNEIKKLKKENEKLASENTSLASRDIQPKTQKEYKWVKQEVQNDRGRTINYYVNKHFFNGSYSQAHKEAKEAFRRETGIKLPSKAKMMSLDQKKEYLNFLSKL